MIALVVGGAASGKSEVAERLALILSAPHTYVATMRHGDADTEARIAKHVRAREGCGFRTVELADDPGAAIPLRGTVLVEDLTNLLLNGLQSALADALACENAVVVANDLGSDGVRYDEFTRGFIVELGALSCSIAERADIVVEVVAGIPSCVKGRLPWDC